MNIRGQATAATPAIEALMAKKKAAKKASPKASANGRRYWLFKSEPGCFSIDDLAAAPRQTTHWEGVRNYQARNMLRDDVAVGDGVLFYHSNADPMAVVGTAEVVRAGYPDHTAFDKAEQHYDPKSDPDEPTWYMVDIRLSEKFPGPITRDMLREDKTTANMLVLARGSRLSVQPVTTDEWQAVVRLGSNDE
jgi:predicted RNA-binding protein with PUA-like domain